MFDKVKAAARAVAEKAGDVAGAGADRVQASVNELLDAAPQLEKVGCKVGDIQLELSLAPGVLVQIRKVADVNDEAFQAVLASNPDNRTLAVVVKLLQQALALSRKINLKGRRLAGFELELGLAPAVRMRYVEADAPVPPVQEEPGAGS
jgi:hypothetical protein